MKTNLILAIFSLFILYSCNCVETNLTKEEREWFSAYEEGQMIIFKSNLSNLDTIIVAEKIETHNNKNCNWFEMGATQPNVMFITLKHKFCNNDPYCEAKIFISKDKEDEKCYPGFSFFGLLEKNEPAYLIPKLEKIKLIMKNKIYSQVYCFEDGLNANGYGINSSKSFCWDKKEGLIKYETHEGEIFELLKKVNKN